MYPPASLANTFETVLTSLQEKCSNDIDRLSDIIVHTRDVLRKRGKEFGVLAIAEALDASIPEGAKVGNCYDVAIAFVALQ